MSYYWELEQHDGTIVHIPPQAVEIVKRRIDENKPINTTQAVIPINQIRSFRKSSKPYNSERLLEEASRVFNEPVISVNGEALYRWVKMRTTRRKWDSYYSKIGSYKLLGDDEGLVIIAFRLPIHVIDTNTVEYCDEDEVSRLDSRQAR